MQQWVQRQPPAIIMPDTLSDLDTLQQAVASCTKCSLHQTRTQTVFGVGNRHAQLMIIGEAPGFHEDKQGEPFVGRAGQLLTLMIKTLGFAREDVYIANILKCRPPENRDPNAEEVQCLYCLSATANCPDTTTTIIGGWQNRRALFIKNKIVT